MAAFLSVSDAAGALNLSSARVRLLVANGDIPAEKIGGRWLVEKVGVERRRRRGSSGGRPFIPRNAWAILCMASGEQVDAIDAAARSRLRRALLLEGLGALPLRLEQRADVARYRAHPGEIAHLRNDERLVPSGVSAARLVGLDLLAGREVDGYVRASALDELVEEHALAPAVIGEANAVLRIVPDDVWDLFLAGRPHAPGAAIALDLIEGYDSRSQTSGKELLKRLERTAP
jgi:excisionase family DNA binding protein